MSAYHIFIFNMMLSLPFSEVFFFFFLPPATKLGQGYVFTRVCDSVHGGGGCYPSMPCSRSPGGAIPACLAGGIPACLAAGLWGGGVPAPGVGGVCLQGEGVCSGGGVVPDRDPPGRLLLRAVRILLECILVLRWIFVTINIFAHPIIQGHNEYFTSAKHMDKF